MNAFRIFSIGFIFVIVHVLILYNLPPQINELHFPYKGELEVIYKPKELTRLANFDGIQYLTIATEGYREFQQSYFPLYPLSIALFSKFIANKLFAGIGISTIFFFLGLYYFKKLAELILKQESQVFWAIVFLLTFPTSFFYQTLYPESLFLFLASFSLYHLYRKNFVLSSIAATLASLCKVQGVLLIIPFTIFIIIKNQALIKKNYKLLITALSPLYGLLLYSIYLLVQYGDPFLFYRSLTAFQTGRSVGQIILLPQVIFRYVKIFIFSQKNFQYFIALVELSTLLIVGGVLLYQLVKLVKQKKNEHVLNQLSLNLFSLAALVLPTLTGTLTSLPRYALISLGFFVAISTIKKLSLKIIILSVFSILHIMLYIYFLKGYFVS